MNRLLTLLCLLLLSTSGFAQLTCPLPEKNVVIFFGNGINTTNQSADRALTRLQEELGDTYNGQTLRYDLAYNKTSGIALDLGQSVLQAQVQFDSQIMGWFNNIGIAPTWFNQWYQRFMVAATNLIADEVVDHVDKYSAAIRHGQKVVVVAHSQGNFYVNAAKIQLAQQLSAEQMQSFAIFGVAVPANNVGGNTGPYYTNHRDMIQYVPGSLSPNWTLQRSNGTSADDVGLVQAHLFNDTYISTDFDLRPALLIGIKAQIGGAATPTPSCDNYRKYFLAPLTGTYPATCNGSKSSASIDTEALAQFSIGSVDMSLDTRVVGYARQIVNTSSFGNNTGIAMSAAGTDHNAGGKWSIDGSFITLGRDGMVCDKTVNDAPSALSRPQDIAVLATQVMKNYRSSFPARSCSFLNRATQLYVPFVKPIPVLVQGNSLTVGELDLDLTAARLNEGVVIERPTDFSPNDYEPKFTFRSDYTNERSLTFVYKQYQGLVLFYYVTPTSVLSCIIK